MTNSLPKAEQTARKGYVVHHMLWFENIRKYEEQQFNNVQVTKVLQQKRSKDSLFWDHEMAWLETRMT